MYLNEMPFGSGNLGVQAASKFYFNHPVQDDTVAESAMLVIQLASPSLNNPIRNPQRARRLQREILDQMVAAALRHEEGGGRLLQRVLVTLRLHARQLQRLPRPRGQGTVLQRVHPRPAGGPPGGLLQLPDRRSGRAHHAQPRLPEGGGRAHGAGHRQGERRCTWPPSGAQVVHVQPVLPAAHRHAGVHLRHRRPHVPQPQRHGKRQAGLRTQDRPDRGRRLGPLRSAECAGHQHRRGSAARWR